MKKFMKLISVLILLLSFSIFTDQASASTKIMWGKTELKSGQIGKVTILSNTTLVKLESNGSLSEVRPLKKGEEYRVYSFKAEHNGLYGVGGGSFVKKDVAKVKYETPSKAKLALLEEMTSTSTTIMWGKTELKLGQIGKVTILSDTDLVKLQSDGSLSKVRSLKKGEEYRVYSYKSNHGGLYGVGGGSFVQKSTKIKYETPSKSKLALLEQQKEMKVHYIDVGQGDSILIQSPNGKNMLIDGGTKSAGLKVVEFLKSKGVKSLDMVVATHPDADHIGGLIPVLNSFSVGTFIDSGKVHTTATYLELLELVDAKNITYQIPTKGQMLWLDQALNITVMHVDSNASDNNDASIVLYARYGTVSFLFTGDAGVSLEPSLVYLYNLKSTILKAGHHGSNTSSSAAFINEVKPSATILSYGKDNSYGHPHSEVVTRLKNVGSKIYSTAEAGNITVTATGQAYSISAKPWSSSLVPPVGTPQPTTPVPTVPEPPANQSFQNCTELRAVYPDGVSSSHPAYNSKHDRDGDGWACE